MLERRIEIRLDCSRSPTNEFTAQTSADPNSENLPNPTKALTQAVTVSKCDILREAKVYLDVPMTCTAGQCNLSVTITEPYLATVRLYRGWRYTVAEDCTHIPCTECDKPLLRFLPSGCQDVIRNAIMTMHMESYEQMEYLDSQERRSEPGSAKTASNDPTEQIEPESDPNV